MYTKPGGCAEEDGFCRISLGLSRYKKKATMNVRILRRRLLLQTSGKTNGGNQEGMHYHPPITYIPKSMHSRAVLKRVCRACVDGRECDGSHNGSRGAQDICLHGERAQRGGGSVVSSRGTPLTFGRRR